MTENNATVRTIGIIGGTGKEGKGLAYRWLKAGYRVLIGSRAKEKAEAAAQDLKGLCGATARVEGVENPLAATRGDVVVLTVPFSAHRETLEALKPCLVGKVLIDVTVPLVPPRTSRVQMPPEGSASQQAQAILGEQTQVVAAFQNVSYEELLGDGEVHCDVLVCGATRAARALALELVRAIGLVGYDAGPLDNAVVVEGLTSVLIGINKQFGVKSSGIKITGVPGGTDDHGE